MRKNYVTIKFSGGDEYKTIQEGSHPDAILRWAKKAEEYKAFEAAHEGEAVISVEIKPVFHAPSDNSMRLTNTPNRDKWYYVDNEAAGIRFEFRKGHLNDMQRVWSLYEATEVDPKEFEAEVKEIVDWVSVNFPEMVTEPRKPWRFLSNEGTITDKKPNAKGKVACYYTINADVAEFIKAKANEMEIPQGKFIEMICKDAMDFPAEN